MKDRDYYPAGAYDDPNAPYNQPVTEPMDFDVVVTTHLVKHTKLETDQYIFEGDEYYHDVDTSEVDWDSAYKDSFYDVPELLNKLVELVMPELTELRKNKNENVRRRYELEKIVDSCNGWSTDYTEIDLDDE